MRLTDEAVAGLQKPDETGEQALFWDSTLKGFGVRCTRGSKSWVVQSRVKGKVRRVTLGSCEELKCKAARMLAKAELVAMNGGVDRNAEKRAERAKGMTLRECFEEYLDDRPDMKPSTIESMRPVFYGGNRIPEHRRHLVKPALSFKDWLDEPVLEISREKVRKRFRAMRDRSESQANLAFRYLGAVLRYFMKTQRDKHDRPLMVENPVSILSDADLWAEPKARRRRIEPEQIGAAWAFLEAARNAPFQISATRTSLDIVELLLLTGMRWSEAAQLEWSRVDLDERTLHLIDTKNDNEVWLPLSTAAIDMLRPRVGLHDRWVFPGRAGAKGYVTEARRVFVKLADHIGVEKLSPHDCRRTWRMAADRAGVAMWQVKLLLNHSVGNDVTLKHYAGDDTSNLRYLRPQVQAVSDWIVNESLIATATNVKRIRRA